MKFKYYFCYVLYSLRVSIWSPFYCSMTIASIFRGGGIVIRFWKFCRVVLLLGGVNIIRHIWVGLFSNGYMVNAVT